MVSFSVPTSSPVLVLALYFGLSAGWHIGKAMTDFNTQRKENGYTRRRLFVKFFWNFTHHYDLGIGLMVVGVALLTGLPPLYRVGGVVLVGFGVGMAYDDREDHPPEGMLQHMRKQVASGVT